MSSKKAKTKTTKKRPQRATSNVFAMFDQSQIQEFKEAFNSPSPGRPGPGPPPASTHRREGDGFSRKRWGCCLFLRSPSHRGAAAAAGGEARDGGRPLGQLWCEAAVGVAATAVCGAACTIFLTSQVVVFV